jgi:hypothetical protein
MEIPPRVRTVKVLEGRNVLLQFTNGVQREIDLRPYLCGAIFEAILKDDATFRAVRVDERLGTLVWINGADIDPDVLYGSQIPAWMEKSAKAI